MRYRQPMRMAPTRRSGGMARLGIGLMFAVFAFFSYHCSTEYNPVTGEKQHVAMTPEQEIALGLQAAPEMAAQHGGLLNDPETQALMDRVGADLVRSGIASDTGWQFEFHVLADPQTINAFALPGGQIFITAALLKRFTTEGELAGVIGHEIGHVVARHGAQRLAKMQLTEGITGAVLVAAGGGGSEAQIAQMIGQLVNMKYGREDELESDTLGVLLVTDAGYDPRALIRVMQILNDASEGSRPPEWMSTHPSHGNRVERINAAIEEVFPAGVPEGLKQ